MYQLVVQIFTLCLITGTSSGVFYIPGSVVSYPKMGKRAFYTNATGNRYPMMGRRSSSSSSSGAKNPNTDSVAQQQQQQQPEVVPEVNEYNKRGVFTQGPHRSFPRVGRSESQSDLSNTVRDGKIRSQILKSLAERLNRNVLNVLEGSDVTSLLDDLQEENTGETTSLSKRLQLPQFLFLIFDENGDNQLSKDEFMNGLSRVVEENLLC